MGLTTWQGAVVRKGDVTIAKNYLNEPEISELNRIVTMFLDFAEDQARRRKQIFLSTWQGKLDDFLRFQGHERMAHRAGGRRRAPRRGSRECRILCASGPGSFGSGSPPRTLQGSCGGIAPAVAERNCLKAYTCAMSRMTPSEVRDYFTGLRAANEHEIEELRATPVALKLRQLWALMTSAHLLGVDSPHEVHARNQVRQRWARLYRKQRG